MRRDAAVERRGRRGRIGDHDVARNKRCSTHPKAEGGGIFPVSPDFPRHHVNKLRSPETEALSLGHHLIPTTPVQIARIEELHGAPVLSIPMFITLQED